MKGEHNTETRRLKAAADLTAAWKRRPLACAALGLGLGLAIGIRLPLPAALGWSLAALGGLGLLRALQRPVLAGLAAWACLAGLGAGLARVQGLRLALTAPPAPELAGLRLRARLLHDEGERPRSRRHIWLVQALELRALSDAVPVPPLPLRLRLSADWEASRDWRPGDVVELFGSLRRPEPPSNPGEFDYRAFLLGRGVDALFSMRNGWPSRVLESGGPLEPRRWVDALGRWLRGGLEAGLEGRALILARGIVLGDKAGLTREDQSEYARSGFADILAVSGAHFGIVLLLSLALLRILTPRRRLQAALGLLVGLGYALVTGFEAPVQRAFALVGLYLLARLLDWECEAPTSLAAGVLAILLFQPGALWEAGFQLSLACTVAVLFLSEPFADALPARWPRWLRLSLGATAAAQVALAPLLAYHFHQLCWPALLAAGVSGLFAVGILGLGLPLAVLGGRLPGAAELLGWPLQRLLLLLDGAAGAMAHWPRAVWSTGLIPAWLPLLFLLWGLAFLYLRGPIRRWGLTGAILLLLAGLLYQGLPWLHRHIGETRLWMLDVGQGDSFLLEFGDGRTLLVDGGPLQPDAGAWVVLPALRALGIQRLDWVLATHADADHIGGLAWVLDQMPCGVLLHNGLPADTETWKAVEAAAERRGVPLRRLGTELPRREDDGPWQVLNPSPPTRRRRSGRPPRPHNNDRSVVLNVEGWLLLTGDLPKAGERRLLKRGLGPVQVLKAGHHGSRSSSSPEFLRALRPAEVLFSCGRANRYGHPSAEALAACREARLWRTDKQGCVFLRRRAGLPLDIRPWRSPAPELLRQAAPAYRSPWRAWEAEKRRAWAEFRRPAALEAEPPEEGDAS